MVDTYKITNNLVAVAHTGTKIVTYDNVIQSYSNYDNNSGLSLSYYRKTTERNSKKNGGIPPLKQKIPTVLIKTKDTGNYRYDRVFDYKSEKFVKVKVPILTERIQRVSGKLSPDDTNLLTNDLWFHNQEFWPEATNVISSFRDPGGAYDPSHMWRDIRENDIGRVFPFVVWAEWGANPIKPTGYPVSDLEIRYASEIAELTEESVRKLYAYIKNVPADLGIGLAESDKTFQTILSLSSRLLEFFRDLKRLNWFKAIRDVLPKNKEELASDYLAYRYGISPLINDVSGLIKEVTSKIEGTYKYKAIGKAMRSYQYEDTHVVRNVDILIKHHVTYGVDDDLMSSLNRLGLTNPKGIVWELIPFSFVVDWFLPIGPWLSSLTSLDYLTVKKVHRSVLITENVYCLEPGPDPGVGPLYLESGGPNAWRLKNVKFRREVLSEIPNLPNIRVKSPISVIHATNFLALVIQVISRSKQ